MSAQHFSITSLILLCLLSTFVVSAQQQNGPPTVVAGIPANYDESHVGTYTLPDPLTFTDGQKVRDANSWSKKRRPEIVRLFEENQFGHSPAQPRDMSFDIFEKDTPAFDGKAIRRQVTIYFSNKKSGPKMDLLVYLPANARKAVPLFLNLSFTANSSAIDDPGIKPGEVWDRDKKRAAAPKGGALGHLDPLPFLAQGIGVATVYYGDIQPDFQGGLPYSVRSLFLKPGQTEPAPNEWGAIAAWGWGLSRALDYLETDKGVDAKRVAIFGISRLGKTVLWAGARDTRFKVVIASCSGEGGAALSRRNYGETIKHLTTPSRYPYWFATNYQKFGDNVDQFPVDAHMLIALIAPRALLLQTGDQDAWADPKGEFLAAVAASPVYRLLGKQALDSAQMPPTGQLNMHTLDYYMHTGGHGTVPSDWEVFVKFLKMYL